MSAEKDTVQGEAHHTDSILDTGVMGKTESASGDDTTAATERQDGEQGTGYWKSFRLLGSVLAIMLLANSLFVGYSMPVNILTVIDADIGPSPDIYLVSLLFTLISGIMLLVVGRLSDIVGRRYFMIVSQLLAVIGSIIAAKASTVGMVIGGTVLTGLAGGAQQLYPLLVQELVPNKWRFYAQAAITLSILPTLGFGPAIARVFVEHTTLGWRWCYWLNVILAGLSVVLFFFFYFPPTFHMINKDMTTMQELRHLDYGGLILYSSGLVVLLLGFTWGQGTYPWSSAHVIAPVIVGIAVLAVFFIYQIYYPLSQPLMPIRLLKIRNFSAVVIVGCVGQMVFYALNLIWPMMITTFFTTDDVKIGLMSSTTGVSLAVGEVIIAPIFNIIGHPNYQCIVYSVLLTLFSALMSLVGSSSQQSLGIGLTVMCGCFVGLVEAVTIVIAGLVVPPEDIGVAEGFYASMRAVTGTMALSIYVSVYSARLPVFLQQTVTSAATKSGLPASSLPDLFTAVSNGTAAAYDAVPGINDSIETAVQRGVLLGYHKAYQLIFLASIAFGGLAIIASVFVQDVSKYMNDFVNKTIHKPNVHLAQGHHTEHQTEDGEKRIENEIV